MRDLPAGWAIVALGEIGQWCSGGTPSRKIDKYFGRGIPWIKSGDLPDGPIEQTNEQITELGLRNSSAKLMPEGTVSIAMYGATIGRLGVMMFPAATNQACANVIPHPDLIERDYLFFYLLSERRSLIDKGQGGAQPNISQEVLKDHPIRIAPLTEQRRIVAKLETLLGKVDECQQRLAKFPRFLKHFRQTVLTAACSGRLTVDWRNENGASESDWRESKLTDLLAEPLTNGRSVVDAASGFPVLRLTCLKHGKIDLAERKIGAWTSEAAKRFLVFEGDFFVSKGNGSLSHVGRGGLVEEKPDGVAFPDTMIRVRPRTELIAPAFLRQVWNAKPLPDQIESAAHTTAGIWKISQKDMEQFVLPVPPLAEQQEIIRRVESLFHLADQLEARYQMAQAHVNKLTQSLLAKAFRGDLVPQDAHDEPAAALLARINAARAARQVPTAKPAKRAAKARK